MHVIPLPKDMRVVLTLPEGPCNHAEAVLEICERDALGAESWRPHTPADWQTKLAIAGLADAHRRVVEQAQTQGAEALLATCHPPQPLVLDASGMPRFRKNAIVRMLLDDGPFDMNAIALGGFSVDDQRQFAQLIGYSVGGYGELDYGGEDPRLDMYDEAAELLVGRGAK